MRFLVRCPQAGKSVTLLLAESILSTTIIALRSLLTRGFQQTSKLSSVDCKFLFDAGQFVVISTCQSMLVALSFFLQRVMLLQTCSVFVCGINVNNKHTKP